MANVTWDEVMAQCGPVREVAASDAVTVPADRLVTVLLCDGDGTDGEGGVYAVPGLHLVNRETYLALARPLPAGWGSEAFFSDFGWTDGMVPLEVQ